MSGRYDRLFFRGPKPGATTDYDKRITAIVDDDLLKGSFFFSAMFMAPEYSTTINNAHVHPFDEILFFHGLDPDNPTELGWEIDLYMGDEFIRHTLTETAIIYLPKHFVHCPIVSRMKKPLLHVFTMFSPLSTKDDFTGTIKQEGAFEKRYDNHVIGAPGPGRAATDYSYSTYLDDDVFKGAPRFTSTFISGDNPLREEAPRSHPYDKVFGFFGVNPADKYELGAEVEVRIGDKLEKHTFNQSTILFVPAGVSYCTVKAKVDRPFVFVECADSAGSRDG